MKNFVKLMMLAMLAMSLMTTTAFAQGKPEGGRGQGGEMGIGMDKGLMRAVVPPRMVLRHGEALGLSADQTQRIEGLVQEFQDQNQGLRENLRQEAQTLRELLEAPQVNRQAALAQADRVMALENQLKRARLEMMIDVKNVLSAEQIERLEELRKERRPMRRGTERRQRGSQQGPQRGR